MKLLETAARVSLVTLSAVALLSAFSFSTHALLNSQVLCWEVFT